MSVNVSTNTDMERPRPKVVGAVSSSLLNCETSFSRQAFLAIPRRVRRERVRSVGEGFG